SRSETRRSIAPTTSGVSRTSVCPSIISLFPSVVSVRGRAASTKPSPGIPAGCPDQRGKPLSPAGEAVPPMLQPDGRQIHPPGVEEDAVADDGAADERCPGEEGHTTG